MVLSFKKLSLLILVLLLAVGVVGCGKSEDKRNFSIATGGTAGTYYPLGVAIAEILNKTLPNVQATAQSTGATIANINMLKEGSVDIAFVQNDIVYYAANGLEMFEGKKVNNLRGLMTLYPEAIQIITLQNKDITKIEDFKGKRIAVGPDGSGTEANTRQILQEYGLTYQDISPLYLPFAQAVSALLEDKVDVIFVTAGVPTVAIETLAQKNKLRMIGISEDKIQSLMFKYPFYSKISINQATYDGVTQNINSIAVRAMLVANNKINAQDGYDITKAILNNAKKLSEAHLVGKLIVKETATEGMPIEMNEGAIKFLKE